MAYNDRFLNDRILKVTQIFDEYNRIGVPSTRIYADHIKNTFFISWSTFRNYLSKSEDVKIKKEQQNQLTIQFND